MKVGLSKTIGLGLGAFLLISSFLGGCTKSSAGSKKGTVVTFTQGSGQTVAQVGEISLTLEEMSEDFLGRQGNFAGAKHLNTDKKKVDYVENQVIQEAMFQEAAKLGYFNHPDVKRDVKKMVVQKMMRELLDKVESKYEPTEEEMKEHYNNNLNFYKRGEAVKVTYISIPFAGDQALARKVATDILKDANQNVQNANSKQFAKIALNHAQKSLKSNKMVMEANETDYLEQEAFESKYGKNSFDIVKSLDSIGKISPLLSTENSYLVMMKKGYRKPLDETFEEALPKIKKRVAFENRGKSYENYVADLRKKYDIKVFKDMVPEIGKQALAEMEAKKSVAAKD